MNGNSGRKREREEEEEEKEEKETREREKKKKDAADFSVCMLTFSALTAISISQKSVNTHTHAR